MNPDTPTQRVATVQDLPETIRYMKKVYSLNIHWNNEYKQWVCQYQNVYGDVHHNVVDEDLNKALLELLMLLSATLEPPRG